MTTTIPYVTIVLLGPRLNNSTSSHSDHRSSNDDNDLSITLHKGTRQCTPNLHSLLPIMSYIITCHIHQAL